MATVLFMPGKGFIKDPGTGSVYLIPGKGFFKSTLVVGGDLISQSRSSARFVFSRVFSRVN